MHRKHKSSKVPNVKLRPRPAASSSSLRDAIADDDESAFDRIIHDRNRAIDAELDKEDGDATATAQEQADGPLAGANFCFTGVTDHKTTLAHAAYQLGAKVEGNLTESTTHLIALNPLSFKYECALSLGLFVLLPQFLFECLDLWRNAHAFNVDTLVRKYTLKPLQNLRVGICGIEDRREREHMKSRLKGLGALLVYPMVIQEDVTHLICGTADRRSSSTLQTVFDLRRGKVGQSDERRAAEQLKCVKAEWVEDCASVAGRLKEDIYDIWTHRHAPSPAERAQLRTSIPLRTFSECKQRFNHAVLAQRRWSEKLLREEGEQKRLKVEGHASRGAVLKKSLAGVGALEETDTGNGPAKGSAGSKLLRIERAVEEVAIPSKLIASTRPCPQTNDRPSAESYVSAAVQPTEATNAGLMLRAGRSAQETPLPPTFTNLVVRLDLSPRDESNRSLIEEALLDCGMQRRNILSLSERLRPAHYCLTSHSGPSADPWSGYGQPVTVFWLEQCMHYERVVNPASSSAPPYLRPAGVDIPVEGAERCVVSLTGFPLEDDEPERIQLAKCLRQMGCKVTGPFSKKNTHLLSAHPGNISIPGSKESKAREWGIPAVGADFIRRMWMNGLIEPPPASVPVPAVVGRSAMTDSLPMEATQQGVVPPPPLAARATSSKLCRDITNKITRSREQQDDAQTRDICKIHSDNVYGKAKGVSNGDEARPDRESNACGPEGDLARPSEERAAQGLSEQRYSPAPLQAFSRAEATDTQASSLAGQSMWATRMEGEVTAFLAARKRGSSSHVTTAGPQGAAVDLLRPVSDNSDRHMANSSMTSGSGSKRRGKLPPKSRRSTSGQMGAASPASGQRVDSVSPIKGGSGYEGEGEEGIEQDAAQILLAHRELAAAQAESFNSATTSDVRDTCLGRQRSTLNPGPEDDDDEKEVDSSMKITYRDPQAERERRRLEELVEGRGPGAGASSSKRSRQEGLYTEPGADLKTKVGQGEESSSEIVILGRATLVDHDSPSKRRLVARKQPGMGR